MQPGLLHFPAYQVHACDSFCSQTRPRNPKRAVPAAHAASSDQSESQSGKMDGCLNKNHRRSEWSRKLEACRDFRSNGHRASHKDGTAMQLKTSWAKSGASLRALAARARRRAVRPRRGMFWAGTHAGPRAFYVHLKLRAPNGLRIKQNKRVTMHASARARFTTQQCPGLCHPLLPSQHRRRKHLDTRSKHGRKGS